MRSAGLALLSLFLTVHVAHGGIFDTLLNTAKDIGAGVQRVGDDVIGAFVDTKDKCPHGGCYPPPPPPPIPVQTVHTVQAVQPVRTIQTVQAVQPRPVITVTSGGVYPYAPRKSRDSSEKEN